MRTALAGAALGIVITAGGLMLATPVRAGQDRPGQIGQARVFVENTGRDQAVPVALQDAMMSTPLNVQVTGTPTVAFAPNAVVQARVIRQAWEYRTARVVSGQDVAAALSAAGALVMGSRSVNDAPCELGSQVSSPPCWRAMRRAIASPSPVPSSLSSSREKRWKMRSRSCSGMPGPLSVIRTSTVSPCTRASTSILPAGGAFTRDRDF